MNYVKTMLSETAWEIHEEGKDPLHPIKGCTFAFDTETQLYLDNRKFPTNVIARRIKKMTMDEKRKRLSNITWSWQVYDEGNGFYMTNSFDAFMEYICRCRFKFGWCYNATFDFAQIDFEILGNGKGKWKPHEKAEKGSGKGYDKGQAFTFESLHNNMGARYAYKLWYQYRNEDRHKYVHAVEFHDFMKFCVGGLRSLLEDLDVRGKDGNPIRKTEMEYQMVDTENLTQDEIDYCRIDVEGLYFAIKKFNESVESQSGNECHVFGKNTNLMTAGGFAKRELLRSMYPNKPPRFRKQAFQREHPITPEQDTFLRENHLYRGGISFVNPKYKGILLNMKKRKMNRYDVNSEYPYIMSEIDDLVGKPIRKTMEEYMKMKDKEKYVAVYGIKSAYGNVRKGMLGFWYDPFKKDYVDEINETGLHLIFQREFDEMLNWYEEIEADIDFVLLWKKGTKRYRPFVLANYETKSNAKKEGNKTLMQVAKLLLNSSYGKLSERIERVEGHYELCDETGAIHFVVDDVKIETASAMNVAIGAMITSYARVFILSKIREICKIVSKDFVYIDTDSIHTFATYDKADAYSLGGLKLEAVCDAVKYLLPKTYIDIEKINEDGTIDDKKMEIHSKGVSVGSIRHELAKKQKGKKKGKCTLPLIDRRFDYGQKFQTLCAMNVRGGKVLMPMEKYLARNELRPDEFLFNNYGGVAYLNER